MTIWPTGSIARAASRISRPSWRLRDQALRPDELESWHHIWGILAFQRGDHRTALARFEEGLRACPSSALIRFSIGQEHVLLGEAEPGFREFDRLLFPAVPRAYALTAARYAYLWNETISRAAIRRRFLLVDHTLGITDYYFVYVRGLPFFGQTWAYLAAFAILGKRFERLASTYGLRPKSV